MPKSKHSNKQFNNYRPKTISKSPFDNNPTLTINRYWIPKPYLQAVRDVITSYKSGTSFNKSVDHASDSYPNLNRNKIAEHALKYIANDY